MDRRTLSAYDAAAADYAREWEDKQETPTDLYALLTTFFTQGTAVDIGCGSGRDTAWLAASGFDVEGYDASEALLQEARHRHPGIRFAVAILPDLTELGSRTFTNVLCETVIMHLPQAEVARATARIRDLVAPGGTLYLSWRITEGDDLRDSGGRLYAAFADATVLNELAGFQILYDHEQRSESSGKVVRRVIARRPPSA
jgi:2-polyprenyl-3-methyl-5-hydroxy-6-metoxy-1,4-benzoquinol methylase